MHATKVAGQVDMKYKLHNYAQMVFAKVNQSTEAYPFSVKGDISLLETALMECIRIIYALFTERLDRMCRDRSGSGEGPHSQ